MNDFDYDILQRKRIAQNARYKKNGSKSRRCTLPQDGMTAAQLKRRNGEMSSYNLSKPMSWAEFKAMPDDLKCEYITGLRLKFNANGTQIAAMIGVDMSLMYKALRSLGLAETTKRRFSREEEQKWVEFCNPKPTVTLDPLEDITPHEQEAVEYIDTGVSPPKRFGCTINSGLLQFTGKAPDIAIALMQFLGDREYNISVEFEEKL